MARLFDDANNEYLATSSTPITAAPFTISAWAYPDANNIYICAVSIGNSGSTKDMWYLDIRDVNDAARFVSLDNSGAEAITTNFTTVNAWNHLLARETSSSDHSCMLNGDTANIGTSALVKTPDDADNIKIGVIADSTPSEYFSGRIAEVAIWDVSLTDAEGVMLSKGVSPLQVRPESLVFYAPLYADEDIDLVGGLALTPTGSPLTADHPPVYLPNAQILQFPSAAGASAALTGTATASIDEDDIVTGGKTIILTLTDDTFVTGTSSEDGIAAGSDSDVAASGTNWDSLIKGDLDNADVVLSGGNTVATITLPTYASYDTDEQETITWTIPAASLTTSGDPIVATPTFTIDAVVSGRVMSSLAHYGGLAGYGGIAGKGGGLAG